jgi:hypothetical protein
VNEVEQAPPPGLEGIPVRPASKPSRVPLYIWSGIALFCLVMFGAALGIYLWSHDRFSSQDLKKATQVKINYVLKGNQRKSIVVSDPTELKALLDALQITDTQPGPPPMTNNTGSLEFTLADGSMARIAFLAPNQLERANWGWIFVTPTFHRKVNDIISRAEKKPIDIMRIDN